MECTIHIVHSIELVTPHCRILTNFHIIRLDRLIQISLVLPKCIEISTFNLFILKILVTYILHVNDLIQCLLCHCEVYFKCLHLLNLILGSATDVKAKIPYGLLETITNFLPSGGQQYLHHWKNKLYWAILCLASTWPIKTKAILEALTPSKEYLFTDPLCWPPLWPTAPINTSSVGKSWLYWWDYRETFQTGQVDVNFMCIQQAHLLFRCSVWGWLTLLARLAVPSAWPGVSEWDKLVIEYRPVWRKWATGMRRQVHGSQRQIGPGPSGSSLIVRHCQRKFGRLQRRVTCLLEFTCTI